MPPLTPPVVAAGSLGSTPQPSLRTGELLIRPWEPADGPAVQAAYEDPAIQRWHGEHLSDAEAATYAEDWAGLWKTERRAGWVVVRNDVLVGRITLTRLVLESGQGEVTYWVAPDARGGGVAPRAVEAVSRWAFDEIGFHRLELEHSTQNEASCRVATKSGFGLEGTARRKGLHADGWHDMHLHARLSDD